MWPKIKNPCWKSFGRTSCYIYSVVIGGQPKLHVTGHSLGAWVAIELAQKFKDRISAGHVFNAGSNPLRAVAGAPVAAAWARLTDDILYGEFYHHHIMGDVVSSYYKKLGTGQTTRYTSGSDYDLPSKHRIINFSEQYDNTWEFPLTMFSKSTYFSQI
jgi:pimeloyl-ACP methyl ester carboxylesterase